MLYLLFLIPLVVEIFMPDNAVAGRCQHYAQEVRRNHFREFGTDYPWHYAVGQLQQESGCRDSLSNDGVGSQGLPQITWSVWGKYLGAEGVASLRTTKDQLRAQALINKNTFDSSPVKKLWVSFQIYNGGRLVLKEISKAGSSEWDLARKQCHRKVVTFSSGQRVDACDINYDYSKNIYKYGDQYRIESDSIKFKFW